MRFLGKVCLVTGGSRGIGEGCVRVFVQNGARVTFCSNDKDEGEALASAVTSAGPGAAHFVYADCSKEADVQRVVQQCVQRWGRIDCLINNVGWHPDHRSIDGFTTDDLRRLMDLNVVSFFLFSKLCLPELRKHRGSIVNISSLVSEIGQLGAVTYAATKGAVNAMSKALAVDEAEHGVRVNTVLPSCIDTPLLRANSIATGDEEKRLEEFKTSQLLGTLGTIQQIGEACLFLAAEGNFCTGAQLNVTGGSELNYGHKSRLPEHQ